MRENTHMDCKNARPLVPSYLDGELSEAQAAPLRKHLLACQPCRADAQAERNLKRWFVPGEAVTVPRDFSARVARLAFAGGAGASVDRGPAVAGDEAADAPREVRRRAVQRETPVLTFVLRMTAAAAILALLASVAIRSLNLPNASELRADDRPSMSLDEALQRLDQIQQREAEERGPDAAGADASGSRTAEDRRP